MLGDRPFRVAALVVVTAIVITAAIRETYLPYYIIGAVAVIVGGIVGDKLLARRREDKSQSGSNDSDDT